MPALPEGITQLLIHWTQGEKAALDQLVPLIYPELRRLAKRHMGRESPDHTLQTSALINEAYLKLLNQQSVSWQNRAHFFAVATQVMRHILIDHARRHRYAKRGEGAPHLPLEEAAIVRDERAAQLIALDEALNVLTALDPRRSRIIELRFFGGLSADEIGEVMQISPATVQREWRAAKAWLHHTMTTESES